MLTTAIYGVLTVCTVVLLAVGGLVAVERSVSVTLRQEHNDVAGFIYAVVGVIYAVLLALVVIGAWEDREVAGATVDREANELAEVFWLARKLPEPRDARLQGLARSYARVVVEEEWPLMEQGRSSPEAWALLDEMRRGIQDTEVRGPADQVLYQEGLDRIEELADARRTRLVEATDGMPPVLWASLVIGAIVTVGFTYLFGLSNTRSHRLMVGALAAMIALVLFTIGALEYPFSGSARVEPKDFEFVLRRFESSDLSEIS